MISYADDPPPKYYCSICGDEIPRYTGSVYQGRYLCRNHKHKIETFYVDWNPIKDTTFYYKNLLWYIEETFRLTDDFLRLMNSKSKIAFSIEAPRWKIKAVTFQEVLYPEY